MKEIILAYIKKPFSLGRVKVMMFAPLCAGILFDFAFNCDFKKNEYHLDSGSSLSMSFLIILLLFFLCLVLIDFKHENNKREEKRELLKSINNPNTPDEIKRKLADQYEKL